MHDVNTSTCQHFLDFDYPQTPRTLSPLPRCMFNSIVLGTAGTPSKPLRSIFPTVGAVRFGSELIGANLAIYDHLRGGNGLMARKKLNMTRCNARGEIAL
jgi:hypothetical protein